MKLKDLLKENPDGIDVGKVHLDWYKKAVPFGMWKNTMYVGYEKNTHSDMYSDENDLLSRHSLTYPGRLWYKKKVIAFWEFPPKNKMKFIISQLEKAYQDEHKKSIKIWNNGYKIEIVDKGGEIYKPDDKRWGAWGEMPSGTYVTLIPLEDYEGSKKQVGKGKAHAISPMMKTNKKVPKGMGSKKQVKGAKKGETPAAARDRLRKGLGDGIVKLKNLLKENPDTVNYNKKDLGYRNDDAYAFGFYKGDAYVGDPRAPHNRMGRDLNDRGEISDREYEEFPEGREEMKHAGRFWLKYKIISFWNYPTQNQMKGVISKLEKVIGKKIWKNGWKLEVIDKGGKIYRPKKSDQGSYGWNKNALKAQIKFIPVEDYAGSQKQVGKEISHQKSPLLKKKKEVPKGIGATKKVKGAKKGETPAETRDRLRKGLGDGIISLGDLLLENPDLVGIANPPLSYDDIDARPFGMWKNKMFVGETEDTHYDMAELLYYNVKYKDMGDLPQDRPDYKFPGRLWTKQKLIAFWDFPKEKQMKGIISKIEKTGKLKIWNNGWQIEVIDKGGKLYNPDDLGWEDGDYEEDNNLKLIPLEDYGGSHKQIGKELSHQKSPLLKGKKEVPQGMGSKKQVTGAKKGETPAAARDRLRKGLGDGVIRLKDLIKEIFILYEDQSDELVKIARTQNGLIDPKGKVYAVPSLQHMEFFVKQPKFRPFKDRLANANANEYSVLYEAILNEAMQDGWVRIAGSRKAIGFTATKKTLIKQKRLLDDIVIFVESVVKRKIPIYRTEFIIRKPKKLNYNKDFGDD